MQPTQPATPREVSNFQVAGQLFRQLPVNGTLTRVWRLIEPSQRWSSYDPRPELASFNNLRTINLASDPPAGGACGRHGPKTEFRGRTLDRGWNYVLVR